MLSSIRGGNIAAVQFGFIKHAEPASHWEHVQELRVENFVITNNKNIFYIGVKELELCPLLSLVVPTFYGY